MHEAIAVAEEEHHTVVSLDPDTVDLYQVQEDLEALLENHIVVPDHLDMILLHLEEPDNSLAEAAEGPQQGEEPHMGSTVEEGLVSSDGSLVKGVEVVDDLQAHLYCYPVLVQ